jgi:very-short-patch-repair endonuclease
MTDTGMKLRARALRHAMTPHERMLWAALRKRRMAGLQFYRQRPIHGYIVDFYCPAAALVIELDGHQHSSCSAMAYDDVRTGILNALGLRVLRFPNHRLLTEWAAVLQEIREAVTPAPELPLS